MKKIIVLVMCTYVVGCRLLLDVDKLQCEEDVQCADQFGSEYVCGEQGVCQKSGKANQDASTDMMGDAGVKLEKRFACINEPATIPAKPKSGKVHLDVQIVDFLSLAPAADVLLNACGVRDSMCSSPLFKDVALDAKGFASLDLPYGFDGFFEAGGGGYVPALFAIKRLQTAIRQ